MDELVMTVCATARETRVLLMHGPDEVMKARLRAVGDAGAPVRRADAVRVDGALARPEGPRCRFSRSPRTSCSGWNSLCDGLGVARATLHYVVQPLFSDDPPTRRGQRLLGPR